MRIKIKFKNMKNCRLKSENCGLKSTTKNSDHYNKEYMKTKLSSDDELPQNKMIKILTITIVVRAVFHGNNKYYPQVFWDECL